MGRFGGPSRTLQPPRAIDWKSGRFVSSRQTNRGDEFILIQLTLTRSTPNHVTICYSLIRSQHTECEVNILISSPIHSELSISEHRNFIFLEQRLIRRSLRAHLYTWFLSLHIHIIDMEIQYQNDPGASGFSNGNFKQEDEAMGGADDNMSTTPTGGQGNGYASHQQTSRRQSTQSADYQTQNPSFPPAPENIDPNARYPSNSSYQQQPVQPYSRPSSGLSGAGDRHGYPQTYQEPNQKSSHQTDPARDQSSVVIKVGMVGDAQIGKTSLMVKYVEGSWDEDYIQTLGIKLIQILKWPR